MNGCMDYINMNILVLFPVANIIGSAASQNLADGKYCKVKHQNGIVYLKLNSSSNGFRWIIKVNFQLKTSH